nr:septin-7-like isoform X2 [Pan paniscus]
MLISGEERRGQPACLQPGRGMTAQGSLWGAWREHTQDLKDVTNNVHYENYGIRKLAAVTYHGVDNKKNKGQLTKSPLAQMEEERREQVAKIKKMEMEMEQVFEMKVKEKVQKLKDSEAQHTHALLVLFL